MWHEIITIPSFLRHSYIFVVLCYSNIYLHVKTVLCMITCVDLFTQVVPYHLLQARHGNGAGWGWVLPSPSPYSILIYLPVTLSISNGDEKLNLIPVPGGFGYPRLIPVLGMDSGWVPIYLLFIPYFCFKIG